MGFISFLFYFFHFSHSNPYEIKLFRLVTPTTLLKIGKRLLTIYPPSKKIKAKETHYVCFTDINECSNNPCKNGATCVNLQGSHRCDCKSGYDGNNCENGYKSPTFFKFVLSLFIRICISFVTLALRRKPELKFGMFSNNTYTSHLGNFTLVCL